MKELMTTRRQRLAAQPLWDFALALYAAPGVEEDCLVLQDDAGIDVGELLWRCWLYRHGLSAGSIPDEVVKWQREVTTPLRRLRRQLKPEARQHTRVAELREKLQRAELDAEREALFRLEAWSLASPELRALPPSPPHLEKVLSEALKIQTKSHFFALQRLTSQLDRVFSSR